MTMLEMTDVKSMVVFKDNIMWQFVITDGIFFKIIYINSIAPFISHVIRCPVSSFSSSFSSCASSFVWYCATINQRWN
jgi:hypothetical protein